jgi:hypothetical protein
MACLACLWMIVSHFAIPPLIERAYRGESLPIFNRLISGQASHPVQDYLAFWHWITWRVLIVLGVFGLGVAVVSGPEFQRVARVDPDRVGWLHKFVSGAFIAALAAFLLPVLLYCTVRIGYINPIHFNEGWNVEIVSRILHGERLYEALTGLPLRPVNYPPLSFLIIAGLSAPSIPILLVGRVVSLLSFLVVACLIFKIVESLSGSKTGAILAALMWAALAAVLTPHYIGSYDPQMMGHVFSMGALYLYSGFKDQLTSRRIAVLAFLCSFALFIKHSLIAIPITLAIALLFSNRKLFCRFALAGLLFSSLMLLGARLYGGEHFFEHFVNLNLDFNHLASTQNMLRRVTRLFVAHYLLVFFLPFLVLLCKRARKYRTGLIYFACSFLVGCNAFRATAGTSNNHFLDFCAAAAMLFGLLAAESARLNLLLQRISIYWILLAGLLPICANRYLVRYALDYDHLRTEEQTYRMDVELLKSFPGRTLFENPLLGFHAGKQFLFDACVSSEMIVAGRIPEQVLAEPIRQEYFSAIVVDRRLQKKNPSTEEDEQAAYSENLLLRALEKEGWLKVVNPRLERWTDNILNAIQENYELAAVNRSSLYFFYVPRESAPAVR